MLLAVLLLASIITRAGEDYYTVLGVKRSATNEELRSAFKKLAIKFHPDKNKDNPDAAKLKFQKIANAYEVLSDPEKKKIYDQFGEEGLKQGAGQHQQQWPGGFKDGSGRTFFFTNGGGGFDFGDFGNFFNRGGGDSHHQRNFFENSQVISLDLGSISKLYHRDELWYVLFYKAKTLEGIEEAYKQLAEVMSDIMKVAAINCDADNELCEEFNAYSTPVIYLFMPNSNIDPIKFTDEFHVDKLKEFAYKNLPHFVDVVYEDNYEEFMAREPTKPKALLFTEKQGIPNLYKVISTKLKAYYNFGLVRNTEKSLISLYGIKHFPTIIAVTDVDNLTQNLHQISSSPKIEELSKFLRDKYTPMKSKSSKIKELSSKLYNAGSCNSDSMYCILLLATSEKDADIAKMQAVLNSFPNDPIHFYYIVRETQKKFVSNFPACGNDCKLVFIKPDRMKYIPFTSGITEGQVKSFISDALGGSYSYKKQTTRYSIL